MPSENTAVQRTLLIRFTWPSVDPQQLLSMMQAAAPFYQAFGGMRMRLLQNVDDPGRFVQEIAYTTPAAVEDSRQQIAADPRVQAYLQAMRTMVPGAVEVDIYREVGQSG